MELSRWERFRLEHHEDQISAYATTHYIAFPPEAELHDRLADIMTHNVVVLHETESVADARKLFARYGFRAIPVVDEGMRMTGLIPYRDIMQLAHPAVS